MPLIELNGLVLTLRSLDALISCLAEDDVLKQLMAERRVLIRCNGKESHWHYLQEIDLESDQHWDNVGTYALAYVKTMDEKGQFLSAGADIAKRLKAALKKTGLFGRVTVVGVADIPDTVVEAVPEARMPGVPSVFGTIPPTSQPVAGQEQPCAHT